MHNTLMYAYWLATHIIILHPLFTFKHKHICVWSMSVIKYLYFSILKYIFSAFQLQIQIFVISKLKNTNTNNI